MAKVYPIIAAKEVCIKAMVANLSYRVWAAG